MSRLSRHTAEWRNGVIAGLRTLKEIDIALPASSLRHIVFRVIWNHYRQVEACTNQKVT